MLPRRPFSLGQFRRPPIHHLHSLSATFSIPPERMGVSIHCGRAILAAVTSLPGLAEFAFSRIAMKPLPKH
jgi:hypothetical protein